MIRIDRNRKDEKEQLISPSNKWSSIARDKTRLLIQAFSNGEKLTFDPQIYGDKIEIRPILGKLFYGKCAYCEAHVDIDTFNWEVEHFRPKARVLDDPTHQDTIG